MTKKKTVRGRSPLPSKTGGPMKDKRKKRSKEWKKRIRPDEE